MYKYHKFFLWFILILLAGVSYGQDAPGSPNVVIDDNDIIYNEDLDRYELHLSCGVNQYDLTGTYNPGRQTDDYEVLSIPYEPPFPFEGGTGSTNITADDVWSNTIDLQDFRFCFYGKGYDKLLLNSNGAMTFDVDGVVDGGRYSPSTQAGYIFSNQLPSDSQVLYVNSIFGVMQDTYPSHSFPGWSINYEIIGEEPYRTFVFNFYKLGLFSNSHANCGTSGEEQTYQMVLYEATNIIDVYVENRSGNCDFNNSSGLIGIQSQNDPILGLRAKTPPGRNTGAWSASNEAWRFRPNGPNENTVSWYKDGVEVSDLAGSNSGVSNQSFTFENQQTVVGFKVEYQICSPHNGGRGAIVEQEYELHVFTYEGFGIDLGDDIVTCDEDPITLSPTLYDEDGNEITDFTGFEFLWSTGETTATITVTESGTYSVTITRDGVCEQTQIIDVAMGEGLPVYQDIDDYALCEIENGEAVFDLTSVQVIDDPLDYSYDYYTSEVDAETETNAIPVADLDNYTSSGERIWVVVSEEDLDPNAPDCKGITYFDLVVDPLPVLLQDSTTLTECEEEVGSGSFDFDLTDALSDLVADPSAYQVDYYTDVDLTDSITSDITAYEASTGDIVYVEFTTDEDCSVSAEIHFSISSIPEVADLDALHECANADGEAIFDLDAMVGDIQDGNTAWTVTFHTDEDAETPALVSPYTSGSTTIFVKVNDAGCFDIVPLELVVDPLPIIVDDLFLEACALEGDSDVPFDLTELIDGLLANIEGVASDYTLTFSLDEPAVDGAVTQPIDAEDAYEVASTTTVWVKLENDATGCFSTSTIELIVHPLPDLLTDEEELNECVGDTFDLTEAEDLLMTDSTGIVFTYYENQADAEAVQNAIDASVPYPGVDGEEIIVRVETEEGCAVYATLTLRLVAAQEVDPLVDYEICDAGNGRADFDLAGLIPGIQNGDANLEVTFYLTEALAFVGDAADQIDLTQDYNSATRTIWVRVVEQGLATCAGVVPLELIVNPLPVLPASVEMTACENPDADNAFDLTDADLHADILGAVVGDASDYDVLFYETELQAENASVDDAIDTSIPYETGVTTRIWVRVVYADGTDCQSIVALDLIVNPLPEVNEIEPLKVCDTGAANGISEFDLNAATIDLIGSSNYIVDYYLDPATADQENPDAADALDTPFTNTTPYNQTIFARVADAVTGCYITVPVDLIVEEAPAANTPEPLTYCDPNNDGEGTFHLPDAIPSITTDDAVTITFHRTEADANNSANPLDDDINNNIIDEDSNGRQIIYVRVELEDIICYSVVELELIVLPTPVLETPDQIIIGCDINEDGAPIFNLEEIVAEQVTIHIEDLDDYNIYYYANEENRDNDIRIPVPSAYPSQGGIIIVVVEDKETGCSTEVEIELFVAPLPEVFNPAPLELCDVNNPGDEKEEFYLDEAIAEITDGDTSLSVSFHVNQADADTGDNPLAIPYENTENNQTIYIRVENEYGCVVTDTITLTLVVNPLPEPVTPEPLEVCDVDNEGVAYFDLESLENEIIANEPDVSISFHETYSNAENGLWPLASPYQNIVLNEQIIYARVENDTTGCFTIVEVILRVMPTPVVPTELDDLYFCTPDVDTGVRINITGYEDVIYGLQNRDELDLTYHLSEADAASGNAPIADPTDFLLNPPTPTTIYVRLAYKNGDCYSIVSFVLHLVEGPQINDPTPLSLCMPYGEANNETAVFDLLEKREEIIGNATGLGIYFYEDEDDALAGNNNYIADPANYTNIENPQVLYVRVVDSQENEDDSGCVAFTTLTLRVDPNPEPVVPDAIEVCHLDNDADATTVDLTIRELQILNQESWDIEYYEKYRDAVNGDQEKVIANPEEYELDLEDSPMTIYVRVINPETGCFEIVELEIILSLLPDVLPPEAIEPMIVCTTDGSGRAVFDLTEKLPEIFGNQNLDGLEVFFYEELDDAIDGINPIIDPDTFTNRETPQIIYVGVGNPEIDDCYIGGLTYFEIEVREGAEAFSPEESYKVCGVAGPEGGVGSFDLRDESLIDTILGLQDPDFFDVDFYLTEEEAEEAEPGTALQSPYENISNPQVIYARVENQDTGCYAIAELTLEVIVLEDLILEDLYSFCTDANGNPMEDADGNIIFPIIDTGLNADDNEFTWYFEGERIIGQVGPSLEADQIGTYTVEIINHTTGCTLSLDIEVVESSMPFNYGAEVTSPAFSGTYNVEAWADGFGDYWFSLNGGAEQQEGSWTNVGPGTHVVTITDANGCGSVDVVVNVVDYPKFFTPNDDGYNDTWNIPGMADLDPSAEIHIFDRHGKLLKQLNPLSDGWDGTFNGKPLPSTDYWFVVKYQEEGVQKEFKGHFSLKR